MAKPALTMWTINKKLVQGAVCSKDMRGSSMTKTTSFEVVFVFLGG
jgi:hypothetical protein